MSRILEVTGLKKSYISPDGQQTLVVDVPEFSLSKGEQVALQGGSGSGKTTFLNLVAGILKADSGTIRLGGTDISRASESQRDGIRANHIGYVFQTFNLLHGYTALENVQLGMLFGKGVKGDRAIGLLRRMGLDDKMNYRPRQLSVGQQQRVAVARALANAPDLVLADEPTGNLDRARAIEAMDLIREVCRENNAALLLVSHDPEMLDRFENRRDFAELNNAYAAHTHTAPEASH